VCEMLRNDKSYRPMSVSAVVSPDVRGAYFGSLDRAFEGFTYVGNGGSRLMAQQVSARK